MSDSKIPSGQRYTHVYWERGRPAQDSPKMRRRLVALARSVEPFESIKKRVHLELGVELIGNYGINWEGFLERCTIDELLDFITIAYVHLAEHKANERYSSADPQRWIADVSRIFAEENLRYRIDGKGGVHPHPDEEFSRQTSSVIAAIGSARYGNVRDLFEAGLASLASGQPDGKQAIRSTFFAVEGLFRLMFQDAIKLDAVAARRLEPVLQKLYATDPIATRVSTKMISAFAAWVDGVHNYRHEPGQEEPAQPPPAIAIDLVSLGASFLRWLAEIDASNRGPQTR